MVHRVFRDGVGTGLEMCMMLRHDRLGLGPSWSIWMVFRLFSVRTAVEHVDGVKVGIDGVGAC